MKRFLLFLLFLGACAQAPPVSERVESLRVACLDACDGETSVTILLPENSVLYTTEEAICIQRDSRLSCGTCGCDSFGLRAGELARTAEARNVTCSFVPGESIVVRC